MGNEKLLSVIIPTYNRPRQVLRAVESVLGQGLSAELEILVVDDGNNSITKEILSHYISSNTIHYLTNPNEHGAAHARNFGVMNSQSKFITFLDDDDCYLPGRLKNMLDTMVSDKYIFVSSARFHEYFNFQIIKKWPNQLSGIITLNDIRFVNDIDIGFFIKRIDFLNLGGFDTSFSNLEDWDFLIRLLQFGNGYKLDRQDYAENVDPNRNRNSDGGYKSYRQLAEKHRAIFGEKWYGIMISIADQMQGSQTLQLAILNSFQFSTITPFNLYLKKIFSRRK